MLGIGFFEIVIIALVSFIAVGPTQLPVVMRKIAGYYRPFVTLRAELKCKLLSGDLEKPDLDEEAPRAQRNRKTIRPMKSW